MAEVRKSSFVKFCEGLAFICAVATFGGPLLERVTHIRVPMSVWPHYAMIAFWPLAFIWFVGTIMHHARLRRARIQAEEAAQRMGREFR